MNPKRENQREMTFNVHRQAETDWQSENRNDCRELKQKSKQKQSQELFCACNGLKCDGICRELHLYRERFAGVKGDSRGTPVNRQWAEKCPSAYEK